MFEVKYIRLCAFPQAFLTSLLFANSFFRQEFSLAPPCLSVHGALTRCHIGFLNLKRLAQSFQVCVCAEEMRKR